MRRTRSFVVFSSAGTLGVQPGAVSVRWDFEHWVRLYRRCSASWEALPVSARGLGDELLRICDDDGRLYVGTEDIGSAVYRLVRGHVFEMDRIHQDTCILRDDGFLIQEG